MKLRCTPFFPFLIWQCLFIQALSVVVEEEADGFHNREEEQEYVQTQQQRMLRTASGKPKRKINYNFQNTEAVTMEVARVEKDEMKRENKFLVPVAKNDDEEVDDNLRHRRQCSPSATATKAAYASGEQVQVIINICQSSWPEWFGIYQAGASPGSDPAVNWQRTCGGQSCGSPQNVGGYLFGLDGETVSRGSSSWPLPPGSYVIFYHSAFGSVSTATFSIAGSGSPPTPPPAVTATPPPTPTPISPPTPPPARTPDQPSLNCVQNVIGGELSIPNNSFFRRDEVHCLRLNGQQGYFGYISPNQFGLFVDGQVVWKAPVTSVTPAGWVFQSDGNMVLRDTNNHAIWTTQTNGNWNSIMKVSFQRLWIESTTGSTLWSQLPNAGSPTPPAIAPTPPPIQPLNCVQTVNGARLSIPKDTFYRKGDLHCLNGDQVYFGYTLSNKFGLFVNDQSVWTAPDSVLASLDRWKFQGDGNLVLRDGNGNPLWATGSHGNWNSILRVSSEGVWIERNTGSVVWAQPPSLIRKNPNPNPDPIDVLQPSKQPTNNNNVNTNGGLQYYAYYYPWYHRNNWSRHGYQDEPLLGKYGTNEVGVAEKHIEWALRAGISTWIVSWWGENSLAMKHFKSGMMNAPSLNKMKFCMLYESVILDGRGNWRDGSKEELLFQHLKVIRDNFFNHPSYLKINGRPVLIFYITRSRMQYLEGFNGPAVLANMRRRLGHNIYFIADEPFFDWNNKSPDGNENAFKNGQQVFDAYTTYNMFQDSRVRRGETATDYQLRESMPVWKRWAEKVPLFPNVMPQYYDFRGHKPLLGNSADFMRQLREVACLPRTNFNGAPHIMMVTSFNEWWEGTQIEPENGSSNNWSNYGFQFIDTLAAFKKEVDSRGTHWC